MKLSELKPCAHCGGKLPPVWYLVKVSQCMLDPQATNQTLGLAQMFQGNLALAEVMGARPDEAVKIVADELGVDWDRLFLCQDCALGLSVEFKGYTLGALMEAAKEGAQRGGS